MSLEEIISGYRSIVIKFIEKDRMALKDELEYFKKLLPLNHTDTDLLLFIRHCVLSKKDDKILKHQADVDANAINAAANRLASPVFIKSLKICSDFNQLYNLIVAMLNNLEFGGNLKYISSVCYYDFSLRIGYALEIYPDKVYVQAGVAKGIGAALPRSISIDILHPELQKLIKEYNLNAFEIENMICSNHFQLNNSRIVKRD